MSGPISKCRTAVSLGKWQLLFPIYACLSLLGLVWLWLTPIEEKVQEQKNTSFKDTLVLLEDKNIRAFFWGIVVLVAADVAVLAIAVVWLYMLWLNRRIRRII